MEGPQNKAHYCWIKNLSRLVRSQLTGKPAAVHICDGCLIFFRTEAELQRHQSNKDCQQICTILPEPGKNFLEFKDFHLTFKLPFAIYCDFEAILKPISSCDSNPEKNYTRATHVHEAYSFAYFIKCSFDNTLSTFRTYRGKDCATVYMKWLIEDVRRIYKNHFEKPIAMKPLTCEERKEYNEATVCFICRQAFEITNNQTIDKTNKKSPLIKVRDHDHFLG